MFGLLFGVGVVVGGRNTGELPSSMVIEGKNTGELPSSMMVGTLLSLGEGGSVVTGSGPRPAAKEKDIALR